mmetsp:Transcript_19941/g.40856  ORF Transcript_19941/g.40856 Transcript_19941/m.40856 type:complete len:202 (+) Transcript_19941:236-841(+)
MQIYPSKSPFQNRPTFSSRQADCPTQTDTITDTTTEFHFFQHKPAPSRTPTQSSFDTAPNSEYPLNSDNKRRPLVPDKQKDYTFELFLFQGANGSKCCQQYRLLVTSYSDDQFHPNSDNRRCRQLIPTTTNTTPIPTSNFHNRFHRTLIPTTTYQHWHTTSISSVQSTITVTQTDTITNRHTHQSPIQRTHFDNRFHKQQY